MNEINLPDGTLELLRVASKNDKRKALANNYALLACYSFSERIYEISKLSSERDFKLKSFLKIDKLPNNFLEFTAICLRRISDRINEMLRDKPESKIPVVSDFDGYALTALGLAYSELIWDNKKETNLEGPSIEVCLAKIKELNKDDFYREITKHYVGNIFQHYFEKAGIRREIAELPEDEEILLRQEDALLVADYCFDELNNQKKTDYNAFDFIESLEEIVGKLLN